MSEQKCPKCGGRIKIFEQGYAKCEDCTFAASPTAWQAIADLRVDLAFANENMNLVRQQRDLYKEIADKASTDLAAANARIAELEREREALLKAGKAYREAAERFEHNRGCVFPKALRAKLVRADKALAEHELYPSEEGEG